MSESPSLASAAQGAGYIGRIPIRNLWFLMFYASDLFRTKGRARAVLETVPDDVPDLVAEILATSVEARLRRHLSLGYRSRTADLNRVRGRIDLLATDRRRLLARGLVACRFDDLTINTPRNCFVRTALETVSRLTDHVDVGHRCRTLANALLILGVTGACPTLRHMSTDRFGRNDSDDEYMVAAARLVFQLALPSEALGQYPLPTPEREEQWVRKLFERAVGGFFFAVLPAAKWQVRTGSFLDWQIESSTPAIGRILPNMKTDIVLDDLDSSTRIIIDTKFTAILTAGWYREETLRSSYVYQIYAYLRSQAGRGDPRADTSQGVLLHPSIGSTVDETVTMQGHRIRFVTVDLTADSASIRAELLKIIE